MVEVNERCFKMPKNMNTHGCFEYYLEARYAKDVIFHQAQEHRGSVEEGKKY